MLLLCNVASCVYRYVATSDLKLSQYSFVTLPLLAILLPSFSLFEKDPLRERT
jgi:hypothetical protein